MKTKKKNEVRIVSVSLPRDLIKKADDKAKSQFQSRSQYISSLIFLDTRLITIANNKEN
jgi:metal-responsive CopG/Arc/MetJ family transcriptional regulator